MRGFWIAGTLALVSIVAIAAHYNPPVLAEPRSQAVVAPPPPKPQNPKQFTAPGFSPEKAARVSELHQKLVTELNDLDPAYGIKKVVVNGTEMSIRVPAEFGVSRMSIPLYHNDKPINVVKRESVEDVRIFVVSARGKPLTQNNLKQRQGYMSAEWSAMMTGIRANLVEANLGREFAIETERSHIWVKPLKLTKPECLPCHDGMKVGQTVALASYLVPKGRF